MKTITSSELGGNAENITNQNPAATLEEPPTEGGTPAREPIPQTVANELAIFQEARVDQNVETFEGGRKLLEIIRVARPQKTSWFRSHPKKEFWYRAFLLEDDRTNDLYFLSRPVWESLVELEEKAITRKLLVPVMSRNNVLTLWPITLGVDGALSSWAESALAAAVTARTDWVQIASNREMGGYEIKARPSDGVEPHWPELDVAQLLRIAFKGRVVTTMDHPIIRDLRGETVTQSGDDRLNSLLGGER